MKHSFVNTLTGIIMACNLGALLYAGYLTYWPFQVITIEPQPYVLQNTVIAPGSYIYYTFHYCKNYDVKAEVIHQLQGMAQIRLSNDPPTPELHDQALRLKDGCATTTKGVYIPKRTPPGEYELYEYVDYQVNPLRTVSYVFKTEPFTVTK